MVSSVVFFLLFLLENFDFRRENIEPLDFTDLPESTDSLEGFDFVLFFFVEVSAF